MISKVIAHSPNNRMEAINALRQALDSYVIAGIRHNCSFLSDVLRHEAFIDGKTPTNFINMHYPDGFTGVQLSSTEQAEVACIAAMTTLWRGEILQRPALALTSATEGDDEIREVIVCLGGMFGTPFRVVLESLDGGKSSVTPFGKEADGPSIGETHSVQIDELVMGGSFPLIHAVINGENKVLQIQNEDNTGVFAVRYQGATFDAIVMSPKEYKLSRHMREPKKIDTSNLILSPMPGTLISYSVEVSLYLVYRCFVLQYTCIHRMVLIVNTTSSTSAISL